MAQIRLSEQQRRIVEHTDGPMLVIAGPGSGKTRVLTERVRHLLTAVPGHFHVLGLTFTNKAALELAARLDDLGDLRRRTYLGTLHGFCLQVLSERGRFIGVPAQPNIFEQAKDRKEVLLRAISEDPSLSEALEAADGDRNRVVDDWLRSISMLKTSALGAQQPSDDLMLRLREAYDAGLRACDAYDFDDLLLFTYRLLSEVQHVGDFYRRLYAYVCIDEAQDLNEAQFAVISALCGSSLRNILLVGDPNQSIYGFNLAGPRFMEQMARDFGATRVELSENFRSSRSVVAAAQRLEPKYLAHATLPIEGEVELFVGADESEEAALIVAKLRALVAGGHPDVEGSIQLARCAILGRTRFALLECEKALAAADLPFYTRSAGGYETRSPQAIDFLLALRLLANPRDRLHIEGLAARWGLSGLTPQATLSLDELAARSSTPHAELVAAAARASVDGEGVVDLMRGVVRLREHADLLEEAQRRAIHEDLVVLAQEWDEFVRAGRPARTLSAFLGARALGTTNVGSGDGVALLTVHAAKGLEFDVVFVVGMADGTFPDFRAQGRPKELAEELRNMFVAVTRSMRLLYLTYPRSRRMPWGDQRLQSPSPYLKALELVARA